MEWIYDGVVPLENKADIEIEVAVHRQIEDIEGEKFIFAFSASKEELQKNTVHLSLDQRIKLDEKEVVIRELSINSVTSSLKLECDKLSLEENQYYFEIADMQGNKFLYSLVKKEGKMLTFQNDGDIPDSDNKWLEGQIYALPYTKENGDTMDFGLMEGEVSKVYRVDSAEMQPIGEKFKIVLKE